MAMFMQFNKFLIMNIWYLLELIGTLLFDSQPIIKQNNASSLRVDHDHEFEIGFQEEVTPVFKETHTLKHK